MTREWIFVHKLSPPVYKQCGSVKIALNYDPQQMLCQLFPAENPLVFQSISVRVLLPPKFRGNFPVSYNEKCPLDIKIVATDPVLTTNTLLLSNYCNLRLFSHFQCASSFGNKCHVEEVTQRLGSPFENNARNWTNCSKSRWWWWILWGWRRAVGTQEKWNRYVKS